MAVVERSNCFHRNGHSAKCSPSNNPFMIFFASIQIVLSQIPNFHKLWFLSIIAAIMSFAYSSIGLGLSISKIAEGDHHVRTTLTGVTVGIDVTVKEKVWRTFQSIGNIALAYAFSTVLIEIQVEITAPTKVAGECPLKAFRFYKTKNVPTGFYEIKEGHLNIKTPWWDGSAIYGSNAEKMGPCLGPFISLSPLSSLT